MKNRRTIAAETVGQWGQTALTLAAIFWLTARGVDAAATASPEATLTFERDIRPIFKAKCFQCHGEGEALKGEVDLRLARLMLKKSDSGTVLSPGKPSESLIYSLTQSGKMPKSETKLTPAQVEKIGKWIAQGAKTARPEPEKVPEVFITEEEREFWSFQPVRRPAVPAVKAAAQTPIDSFLLAKLEAKGLSFAPEADKRTLARRATFDLTGLPPTPEETERFANDPSPQAWENLIDRLLASPHYGERWGRHWLDVAGYADSNGYTGTDSERAWAWRYRDYVTRSLNDGKPFDQFITEQLAGDELVSPPFEDLQGPDLDKLIATGFLRMAPDGTGDDAPDQNLARNQVIADTIQIVGSGLMGLTVNCAQCHDHRYDPIPQVDYYRMRAIFDPAFDWKNWRNPGQRLVSLQSKADGQKAAAIETEAAEIDKSASKMEKDFKEAIYEKRVAELAEPLRTEFKQARQAAADKRTPEQKKLLRDHPELDVDNYILGEVDRDAAKKVADIRAKASEKRGAKPPENFAHALVESPGLTNATFLFARGDHEQPKQRVSPGGLTALSGARSQEIPEKNPALKTTGRRLAFARMLTDGTHPLTARVLVNRVWHHQFGMGIVSTPGDFGALGERPSHPELLDWLASEFMEGGWKLKPLHKLIMMSAAYRQSSVNPAAQAADPDNRLLGRMRLKRLDGESLRDGILAANGLLNREMFGRPLPIAESLVGEIVVGSQVKDGNGDSTGVTPLGAPEFRRALYAQARRSRPLSILETFDAPPMNPNCQARPASTVAPQSLMLMNDKFVVDQAERMAERLRRERPGNARAQIALAWQALFAAQPTQAETRDSLAYLAEQTELLRANAPKPTEDKKDKPKSADPQLQALSSLCQALMGSNRFLYID